MLEAANIEKALGRLDQAQRRNNAFLAEWPGRDAQNIAAQHTKTR